MQGVSRLVDFTAGGDFLGLCGQKSSYKHVSDFGRLRSYGHFLIPGYVLVWTASYGTSWRVIYTTWWFFICVAKIVLPPDSPNQLQTAQFPSLNTWKVFKGMRGSWGGWVFAWPVHTAWLSYYYVLKDPFYLHYSDCAGSWCSEQYGDSFVKAWAVEATE